MPKKGKQELPEITDNLDNFVEKLLNIIADESEGGLLALLHCIQTAKEKYEKPIESWGSGWIYQITRTRGNNVSQSMNIIRTFPDAYTRLQEMKQLAEEGEWEYKSSFNWYLWSEIIQLVPGYKPLDEDLIYPITIKIKNKALDQFESFMFHYKANQKLVAERNKELETTRQSNQLSVENILVASNLQDAQKSAKQNSAKIQFLFVFDKPCVVSWIDGMGKIYELEPGEELLKLLVDHKIDKLEGINQVLMKRLKQEFMKARTLFLDKIQLIVNPKNPATHEPITNQELIRKELSSTFVLRGKPYDYSLYWINTIGKVNAISLESYPQLNDWLNLQNSLTEENIPQLKAFLLQVNTSAPMKGIESFKKELTAILSRRIDKNNVVESDSDSEEEIMPGTADTAALSHEGKPIRPLNLKLFAQVAKCLGHQEKPAEKTCVKVTEVLPEEREFFAEEEPIERNEIPLPPPLPPIEWPVIEDYHQPMTFFAQKSRDNNVQEKEYTNPHRPYSP